jgi:SAM-dependent methyltransferase
MITPSPIALREQYAARGVPIEWPVPDELAASVGIAARDRSASMIASMDLAVAAPLNGALRPSEMELLVRAAEQTLLDRELSGVGIDLGAGLGILASVVATRAGVDLVLAVEVCPHFVEAVVPRAATEILGSDADKVVPVLGSFEDLRIPDESLDFAVEIDSLHHADDLDAALRECARVLRPGGTLLCFDRVQPDDLSDELRERMLDRVYSEEWIAENGYPPGIRMTRRENGEHEIRASEWRDAFARHGLVLVRSIEFVPEVTPRMAAKGAVSWLPRPLRSRLVSLPAPRGFALAWARRLSQNGQATATVAIAPKRCTGLLVRKAG